MGATRGPASHRGRGITSLAALVVILAAFLPGHLAGYWLQRGFAVAAGAAGVLALLDGRVRVRVGRVRIETLLVVLLATTLFYTVSILSSSLDPGISLGLRDVLELSRYPTLGAILVLLWAACTQAPDRFVRALDLLALAVPAFALATYFIVTQNLPGDDLVRTIYEGTKSNWLPPGGSRLSPPLSNPNDLGVACVWTLVWTAFFARRFSLMTLLFSVAGIFLSGSRTAWFVAAVVLALYLVRLVTSGARRDLARLLTAGVIIAVGALAGWQPASNYDEGYRVAMTLRALRSPEGITSDRNLSERLDAVDEALDRWAASPLLGEGSIKVDEDQGFDAIDNQFASWLVRQGLLGTLSIAAFYGILALGLFDTQRRKRRRLGLLALLLATTIPLLTGTFFDNQRLWTLWLAMVFGAYVVAGMSDDEHAPPPVGASVTHTRELAGTPRGPAAIL